MTPPQVQEAPRQMGLQRPEVGQVQVQSGTERKAPSHCLPPGADDQLVCPQRESPGTYGGGGVGVEVIWGPRRSC